MNISSLVVHARPEHAVAVAMELARWPGVEVPASTPDGRLVVTVETVTDGESSECFGRIGALEGVMSVALVYHQFEPEPDPDSHDALEEARHV